MMRIEYVQNVNALILTICNVAEQLYAVFQSLPVYDSEETPHTHTHSEHLSSRSINNRANTAINFHNIRLMFIYIYINGCIVALFV